MLNLAYRCPPGYGKSWTGEGNIISGHRITLENLKKIFEEKNNHVFGAVEDEKICGSITVQEEDDGVISIISVHKK